MIGSGAVEVSGASLRGSAARAMDRENPTIL